MCEQSSGVGARRMMMLGWTKKKDEAILRKRCRQLKLSSFLLLLLGFSGSQRMQFLQNDNLW